MSSEPTTRALVETPHQASASSRQAFRIACKFGGTEALAKALGRSHTTVLRWTYPRGPRGIAGTDGRIPSCRTPDVLAAAERLGISLGAEDWTP